MPDSDKQKKVLVMEDEPVICRLLLRTLESNGFNADSAENGSIAKEKIDAGKVYDLFIFDIKTPVLNGMQLYEYLEEAHPGLIDKVIFMTGDTLNTSTANFLERVKRPYICKPFTPNQMLEAMELLIRKAAV